MGDVTQRGRRAFWALAVTVVVLTGVPSLVLVEAARDYWRFLSGWHPGVLKPTVVRRVPHREENDDELPDIRFVEFSLKAPQAKSVGVAASFNGFDPAALVLERGKDGVWRASVPLPPGTYEYAFEVDGRWTPDPVVTSVKRGGRDVSVRTVE